MKVRTYTHLKDLPVTYRLLFEQCGRRSFFYSLPWFENLARHVLNDKRELRVYAVEKEDGPGTPVAALLTCHSKSRQGLFEPRALSGFSNYYTSLFGPLVDRSAEQSQEALVALAHAICSESPRWDCVRLSLLDAESFVFSDLVKSFQSAGMIVQRYFCFGNWYVQVNGRCYRDYFESLPRVFQDLVNKRIRKLERSGRARLEIITGGERLDAGIAAYEKVYRASWKTPEPYPEFVPGLIRTGAEMGWLRLGVLCVDEQPAAAELHIVNGGVASSYKCAYDQRFRSLSVGTVLTARMLEHVMDVDKVREVDFLTGDDNYKGLWMSHRRERWGLLAMNPRSLHGLLAIIRNLGGRAAKMAWRRLTGGLGSHPREIAEDTAT